VVVDGALAIASEAVLELGPGSTVYVGSLDNNVTINENGGTLVVPEPASTPAAAATCAVLAALARRSRTRR
jgi:ribosomal protein S11